MLLVTYPAKRPDRESVRDPPGGTGPNGSNLAPGGTAPLCWQISLLRTHPTITQDLKAHL